MLAIDSQKKKIKLEESPLIAIQKQKKVVTTVISSWEDLFSNTAIMAVIIPDLHLFDIINIARTSRRLYRFYYGDTCLSNLLRETVLRDIGCSYKKKHPLRYLGVTRNTKKSSYRDRIIYTATCCSGCSKHLRLRESHDSVSKYIFCSYCTICHCQFFHTVYKVIESKCKEIYSDERLPRISRYLERFAIHYGLILKGLTGSAYSNEVNRLIVLLSLRVSNLDISRKIIFNLLKPVNEVIKLEIKVVKQGQKRERDAVEKYLSDPRPQKFSNHLYNIEDAIWNGEMSFSDFFNSTIPLDPIFLDPSPLDSNPFNFL